MKIKKNDKVLSIAGKDKGKQGTVIKTSPKTSRIMVEGINVIKKHVKPKRQGEKGQIVQKPAFFSVSNVKLICPNCGKHIRVSYKFVGDKKVRFCKKCNKEI